MAGESIEELAEELDNAAFRRVSRGHQDTGDLTHIAKRMYLLVPRECAHCPRIFVGRPPRHERVKVLGSHAVYETCAGSGK